MGMKYLWTTTCYSALGPKVLGTYERELHQILHGLSKRRYDNIIVVGCGEGYYAVGLALLMKDAQVFAYDIDQDAREYTRILAKMNRVSRRVVVRKTCDYEELRTFSGRRVLVICDIDGGERSLLDPTKAPALVEFDLLVEIHDGDESSEIKELLTSRFSDTHVIDIVRYGGRIEDDFTVDPSKLSSQERKQLLSEWRRYGIEWGFFQAKMSTRPLA